MDIMRDLQTKGHAFTFDVDSILIDKIITFILELNSICSDRMGVLHSRIHPLK